MLSEILLLTDKSPSTQAPVPIPTSEINNHVVKSSASNYKIKKNADNMLKKSDSSGLY